MKAKTAKRFLSRNQMKMARHRAGIGRAPASFLKRWKQATQDMMREQ